LCVFVRAGGRSFAVKETSVGTAEREFGNYTKLRDLEIPTLVPVGIVQRDDGMVAVETPVGGQLERNSTGYLITELMEKVIPDSHLFRRSFTRRNRNRIWDAVVQLMISLHTEGVYWGDASLANMLIRFTTETMPEIGSRTRLAAISGGRRNR